MSHPEHGFKKIVPLPITTIPCGSSATIQSEPWVLNAFVAKELVVPAWCVGHHLYVDLFKVGKITIIDKPVILDAFRDYRFGPRTMETDERIMLIISNHMGMHQEVALSVKGRAQ